MKSKIAYLCSSLSLGGLEMNHVRNAKWMQERGHDICVFGVENSPFHQQCVASELPFTTIKQHKRYYDFKAGKKLANILAKKNFTHLIIRHTRDKSILANIKFRLKDKIHTSYFMEMELGFKKKNILQIIRFRYLDLWSCPLNWLKEQVETKTFFRNQLIVIPSGIEQEQFSEILSRKEARQQITIPQNVPIFGLVGRFDPKKGQLLLLEAMEKAKDESFGVLLLGEPTKNEGMEYTEQIQAFEKKYPNRIFIRPFVDDLRPIYSAIDWLVMASEAESIGMVTIESLASGTPVLGSNAGGTPEILENESGGKLFETLNSDDLAEKIKLILSSDESPNPTKLKKIATKYNHHSVCEKVEKVLGLSNNN